MYPLKKADSFRIFSRTTGDSEESWNGRIAIVGGCGHVGLPLGMSFAAKGLDVDLVDTDPGRVASVNAGRMPFQEDGADELLPTLIASGRLKATRDCAVLEQA